MSIKNCPIRVLLSRNFFGKGYIKMSELMNSDEVYSKYDIFLFFSKFRLKHKYKQRWRVQEP